MMTNPIRTKDDINDEVNDLIRRVGRLNKRKFVKQSIGVRLDEEPISQQHFKELAHAIRWIVGSQLHEQTTPPMASDAQPT